MQDIVYPLKIEDISSGGSDVDFSPTEIDPAEDYIACKGICFEAKSNVVLYSLNDSIVVNDNQLTNVKLSEFITQDKHYSINQLVHMISGNNVLVIEYDNNMYVTHEVYYADDTLSRKIREYTYQYSDGMLVEYNVYQYDDNGNMIARETHYIIYDNTGYCIKDIAILSI